jgi:hypothetical protein
MTREEFDALLARVTVTITPPAGWRFAFDLLLTRGEVAVLLEREDIPGCYWMVATTWARCTEDWLHYACCTLITAVTDTP